MACHLAATEAYVTSRRERKEHLKRILKLDRPKLRRPNCARDEFHPAAAARTSGNLQVDPDAKSRSRREAEDVCSGSKIG